MGDIFIPIGFFAMVVVLVWLRYKFSIHKREIINKERMALIEKGVYDFPQEEAGNKLGKYLFIGFILLGIGIALLIYALIMYSNLQNINSTEIADILIFGLIVLFLGLGILLFYLIQSKKEKNEKINTNSNAENISE
jgi:pilus assembly protein TadC